MRINMRVRGNEKTEIFNFFFQFAKKQRQQVCKQSIIKKRTYFWFELFKYNMYRYLEGKEDTYYKD